MKPFLRWAGSKRQLLPQIKKHIPASFERYVEPFAGSASLFFDLAPPAAIIGDINSELIQTYRTIQRSWKDVAVILQSLVPSKDCYYTLRRLHPSSLGRIERAARFIYLNRFCFNGLYRTNNNGEFNVPYGGERTGQLPKNDQLKAVSMLLRHASLISGSFESTLSFVRNGDFVYMDPPYARHDIRTFTEYSPRIFGRKDLILIRSWMEKLYCQNIPFVVTYADSEEARILAKGFRSYKVETRRSISGFIHKRKTVWDVIIVP